MLEPLAAASCIPYQADSCQSFNADFMLGRMCEAECQIWLRSSASEFQLFTSGQTIGLHPLGTAAVGFSIDPLYRPALACSNKVPCIDQLASPTVC